MRKKGEAIEREMEISCLICEEKRATDFGGGKFDKECEVIPRESKNEIRIKNCNTPHLGGVKN